MYKINIATIYETKSDFYNIKLEDFIIKNIEGIEKIKSNLEIAI
jgi:hypothetical protein